MSDWRAGISSLLCLQGYLSDVPRTLGRAVVKGANTSWFVMELLVFVPKGVARHKPDLNSPREARGRRLGPQVLPDLHLDTVRRCLYREVGQAARAGVTYLGVVLVLIHLTDGFAERIRFQCGKIFYRGDRHEGVGTPGAGRAPDGLGHPAILAAGAVDTARLTASIVKSAICVHRSLRIHRVSHRQHFTPVEAPSQCGSEAVFVMGRKYEEAGGDEYEEERGNEQGRSN